MKTKVLTSLALGLTAVACSSGQEPNSQGEVEPPKLESAKVTPRYDCYNAWTATSGEYCSGQGAGDCAQTCPGGLGFFENRTYYCGCTCCSSLS
jgi:hypothetical protein